MVGAQVMAYCKRWIEWIFFPDFCGYLGEPAQVRVFCRNWIEGIFFPDLCGYFVVRAQVLSTARDVSSGSSSRTSAATRW